MNAILREAPSVSRTLAVGPELQIGGGTHFRLWAPKRRTVELVFFSTDAKTMGCPVPLEAEGDGYFSALVPEAVRVLGTNSSSMGDRLFPIRHRTSNPMVPMDTLSWSIIAPSGGQILTGPGVSIRGQVMYELHIGTFTPGGTYESAKEKLPLLRDLGVTVIEVMPVACFPGEFGWGYDGVHLYAPYKNYGTPNDFRSFIDYAHSLGLGVILDVVYNHLGPDGNYLTQYSDDYFFHRERATEWGDAINFDGENSGQVRELFAGNVEYWIREFHLDGLRFDATQSIFDQSREHILSEMARRARAAAGKREIILVAENESQEAKIARAHEGKARGIRLRCTLERRFSPYRHRRSHRAASRLLHRLFRLTPGVHFQHEVRVSLPGSTLQLAKEERRGEPTLGMEPAAFVTFLENHDQVSNSAHGKRLHQLASPAHFARAHRAHSARSGHATAFSRSGVWIEQTVHLLCRSRPDWQSSCTRPG